MRAALLALCLASCGVAERTESVREPTTDPPALTKMDGPAHVLVECPDGWARLCVGDCVSNQWVYPIASVEVTEDYPEITAWCTDPEGLRPESAHLSLHWTF